MCMRWLELSTTESHSIPILQCIIVHIHTHIHTHIILYLYLLLTALATTSSFVDGTNIKIICQTNITYTQWLHNEGSLPPNAESWNNVLYIKNATVENEGKYICEGHSSKRFIWTGRFIPYAEYHILKISGIIMYL